ncbi:type II toxin-antitoxin system RelB family antitoxin [Ornithinimicrobium sp. Y1847]|uniref:type II toxin-antitoxin system RelB family antitoxin n=1 Tax=unclassified Ornithinimicrobium TaxID=2615080 RepID=UPI003B685BEC
MATRQLNTSVNEAIYERLERLAARTGRSRSHYAAEFIERGLNDLEDHYLLKDALEEFYASDEAPVAHEDVDWDALGR